jgi:hypothetical protein
MRGTCVLSETEWTASAPCASRLMLRRPAAACSDRCSAGKSAGCTVTFRSTLSCNIPQIIWGDARVESLEQDYVNKSPLFA